MGKVLVESREEYLLTNLERAINSGWIEVYSQPVIRASNGRVCEEELFARWDDPVLGILNPYDFIPVLEKNGVVERLDLYILEKTLDNIKQQSSVGVNFATTSINISLTDFQNKNFVKEIEARVSAAGVSRSKIAFELSENTALIENHKIAVQLAKLKKLGYRLEIDDFGYNCIPLMLSPLFHFDALKLNMELIRHVPTSQKAVTIVDGLIKMSRKLGMDVIAKGVEDKKQVDYLCEIGCAKFQGFYYSRPVATADLYDFARTNKQFLTIEDAREEEYYTQVDKINIHELYYTKENSGKIKNRDNEAPIAVLEISDDEMNIIRMNNAFTRFISENFPEKEKTRSIRFSSMSDVPGAYVISTIRNCVYSEEKSIIEDRTPTGKTVHMMIQKIAENPVTGRVAVLFSIIFIENLSKNAKSLSYNYIARALSEDYVALYIVDIETNNFVEYHTDAHNHNITIEKTGKDYFYDARNDVENKTYYEDRKMFRELCTKENVLKQIAELGAFSMTYRADDEAGVRYVNYKAVIDKSDDKHIIIGVNSVDRQIKLQQAFKSLQEEKTIFSRIAALSGKFFAIYTVNLEDNTYSVYKTAQGKRIIGKKEGGDDFFADASERINKVIHPDDLKEFKKFFKKDNLLKKISDDGFFEYQYRLLVGKKQIYIKQKGVTITENDEQKLVIGLINIDEEVKKDKEYAENLSVAETMALKDELTGVKNKNAYALAEKELANLLKSGEIKRFALVVSDINDLKYINDNFGHKKGDEFIKAGCKILCETFAHSPVYRIGGDEFVIIVQGKDYDERNYLMGVIEKKNNDNKLRGNVTMAVGIATGTSKSVINDIFIKADAKMYEKKKKMKEER